MQSREAQQRVHLGVGSPTLSDFAHRGQQRVDLDRLAGFDVLQHRGLEGAELARHGVPVLGPLARSARRSRADLGRLRITLRQKR